MSVLFDGIVDRCRPQIESILKQAGSGCAFRSIYILLPIVRFALYAPPLIQTP